MTSADYEPESAAGVLEPSNGRIATVRQTAELDAHNVRRAFRQVVKAAGLSPAEWTPRELRHSFVSLLSDGGMSIEDIADLLHAADKTNKRPC